MRIQIFLTKQLTYCKEKIVLISFTDNSCAINGIFYSFIYKKGTYIKIISKVSPFIAYNVNLERYNHYHFKRITSEYIAWSEPEGHNAIRPNKVPRFRAV